VARPRPLPAACFDRDAAVVAPELLGKLVVGTLDGSPVAARLVEVEAYRGHDDPGSHAFRGRTARNAAMFGPAGHWYVYFVYGMHWCANVVCGPGATPHAVLLRAAVPEVGADVLARRRPTARRPAELLRGPANLARALGMDGADDGTVLGARFAIVDDGWRPDAVVTTERIGLAPGRGDDLALRFAVADDPHVSGPRRLRSPPGSGSSIRPG
jgi:DNA-3-methyladenine glycosylase